MMPFAATISVVTIFDPFIIRPDSPKEIAALSPFAMVILLPIAAVASIEVSGAPAT